MFYIYLEYPAVAIEYFLVFLSRILNSSFLVVWEITID
jgi:hypothetical protein